MFGLLRLSAALIGTVLLYRITVDLLDGQISYSIGDTDEIFTEQVATQSIPEALAVWLTFGAVFFGLIIFGVKPRWFVEKKWLWKAILAAIFLGYTLGSLLR